MTDIRTRKIINCVSILIYLLLGCHINIRLLNFERNFYFSISRLLINEYEYLKLKYINNNENSFFICSKVKIFLFKYNCRKFLINLHHITIISSTNMKRNTYYFFLVSKKTFFIVSD